MVSRGQELGQAEEEEGECQRAQHEQDDDVGLQRRDEEDDGEETPYDEEDAEREAEGSLVAFVGFLEA